MFKELIEKELKQSIYKFQMGSEYHTINCENGTCDCEQKLEEVFREFGQTIAKEVAMIFKKDVWDPKTEYDKGYVLGLIESNNIVDQIINEVSE